MFDYLLEKNNLKADFLKYGLTDCDLAFIKEQIMGPSSGGSQSEVDEFGCVLTFICYLIWEFTFSTLALENRATVS